MDAVFCVVLNSVTEQHLNLPTKNPDHVGKPDSYAGVQQHHESGELNVAELKLICAPTPYHLKLM